MGVPHLYNHLRPYARPAVYNSAAQPTLLYVDGPGLAYHVYNLALCSRPLPGGRKNPWESMVEYTDFAGAVLKYLHRLEECGFDIKKFYFDGHLPYSKRSVRLERLTKNLQKLQAFNRLHPSIRSLSQLNPPDLLNPNSKYYPHVAPLSAPPFIIGATIEALGQSKFAERTRTVPGEAESFCARDAAEFGGIVLTGDSDLLLYSSSSEKNKEWGVIMFKDLSFSFSPTIYATARTFMPEEISKLVGVDLKMFAWECIADRNASFNVIRERVKRLIEQQKKGVRVDGGRRWREFLDDYKLPAFGEPKMIAEPRIAEILNCGAGTEDGTGAVEVFLPFLWEDPTRSSAWDVGKEFRSYAYSLLVAGDGNESRTVTEFVRRGNRIAAVAVNPTDAGSLSLLTEVENWWVKAILDSILAVYADRGQSPPNKKCLEAAAWMLSPPSSASRSSFSSSLPSTPVQWTWEVVHFYSQIQAGYYSLLLLQQLLLLSPSLPSADTLTSIPPLPPISAVINTRNFLDGHNLSGPREQNIAAEVLRKYNTDLAVSQAENEQDGEMSVALASDDENILESVVAKGSSGDEKESEGLEVAEKKRKKTKREKEKEKEKQKEVALSMENMFAVLAQE